MYRFLLVFSVVFLFSGFLTSCGDEETDVCEPACGDRVCGQSTNCDDSNIDCGSCDSGFTCTDAGQCEEGECVPECGNRECGESNCPGISCGECDDEHICNGMGQCAQGPCVQECGDAVCGESNCPGQSCGECEDGFNCDGGQCVEGPCVVNCSGAVCGPSNCDGESCGDCENGFNCEEGQCVEDPCVVECGGAVCGESNCPGESCGECDEGFICDEGDCVEGLTNPWVAFVSKRNEDTQHIFLIKADGSGLFEFTDVHAMDLSPVWSPDGTSLAFQRLDLDDFTKDIIVYDFRSNSLSFLGTGLHRIGSFSWSPDGDQLVLEGRMEDGGDYNDIWVVELDGGNPVQLTTDPESDSGPVWNPDGEKIIFNTKRNGFDDIYMMDTDGSNQEELVGGSSIIGKSTIAPDGDTLIYSRFISMNAPAVLGWISISDCMEFNCFHESISAEGDTEPAIFPDGSALAVTRIFDTTNPEVVLITLENEEIIRLTDEMNIDGQATVAPINSSDSPVSE